MENEKLISIIVPVYNVQEYITKCIESLINQTYKNIEIILVDDGSTDNSGNICDEYKKKDKRVIVVHKLNGGVGSARNKGLDSVRGEYIAFVDPDDYVDEKMIERMYTNINKENADISIISCCYVYDTKIEYPKKDNQYLVMDTEEAFIKMNSFVYYGVGLVDKLFKRSLFNGLRFPNINSGEDWYVIYKVFDKANKVVYDSKVMYYYRQRLSSLTHNKTVNFDCLNASRQSIEIISKKYPKAIKSAYTMYVTENIGVYDKILLSKLKSQRKDDIKELRKNVKNSYTKMDFSILPKSKKVQVYLFSKIPIIYDFIFKMYYYQKSKRINKK